MFSKRKRILRKAIQEEVQLMQAIREDCEAGKIPAEDCSFFEARWEALRALLNRIAPREPIKWRELGMRLGAAMGVFLVVSLPIGIYVKQVYFPSNTISSSVGTQGEVRESRFIPEIVVDTMPFPKLKTSRQSEVVDVVSVDNGSGSVVEVVAWEDKQVVDIFYTRDVTGSVGLYRVQYNWDLNEQLLGEQQVLADYTIIDASIIQDGDGYLVAYVYEQADGEDTIEQAAIQRLSSDLANEGSAVQVHYEAQESAIGLEFRAFEQVDVDGVVLDNGYMLTTTYVPAADATIIDKQQPILRTYAANLEVTRTQQLETGPLKVGLNKTTIPYVGGFYMIIHGRDPLAISDRVKGDELYMLKYDEDWLLLSYLRMTNNGLPHDFWPTSAHLYNDQILTAYQRIQQLPQFEGDESGYATDAGKVFVTGLYQETIASGTINAGDYSVRLNTTDMLEGGNSAHMDVIADRLFIAHDYRVEGDPYDEGDGDYRVMRIQFFDLQ